MIAHNITVHTTLNITDSPSKAYGLNYEAKILMVVALVVLILLILFGNWLVIGIFCQYRPLRTVTNYFIVSLAVADILVAVFCIPIWIAYIQTGLVEQKFGIVIYRFWICLDIMSGIASVMNLTFVSVDRYICVIFPLRYRNLMTSKRGKIMICIIWLYATGMALVKAIAFDWPRPNYEILIFVLGFLLPLCIMGVSYCRMFRAARHQRRQICNNKEKIRDYKAMKTIALVMLAFFVCWGPFCIINLLYGLWPTWTVPSALVTMSKWLHYANSALNPIIYACYNSQYRSAFRALLARKRLLNDLASNNGKHNHSNIQGKLDIMLRRRRISELEQRRDSSQAFKHGEQQNNMIAVELTAFLKESCV